MSSDYTLAYGTHATPEDGRCAMEWVSYIAGEPHSDQPGCVSPVLRAFCIALNDGLDGSRASGCGPTSRGRSAPPTTTWTRRGAGWRWTGWPASTRRPGCTSPA